ncbi:hypothetical protein [Nocardia sp. NBC_01327]|uniref:hypothetical protein n=1 Tax=Nocardia sp. NBC_01327 TaxID=2903593 RepID=UPI002E1427A9|nr:hypothetical protein OG326_09175 [Nocardia sp. NBC_01327]
MQLSQEQLVDLVGEKASAAAAFGEPVTADGITVIPVARASLGFGGASGSVGGGTEVRPLGYIEIRNGVARYRPIRDTRTRILLPLTAIAAGFAAPWLIRSVNTVRSIGIRRRSGAE